MGSDYNRLLREVEEEVGGYNDTVYDAIAQDLENMTDNLSNEYFFSEDVKSGNAAQDVYDWVRQNKPEALEGWLRDVELVMGDDAIWSALEALKKVELWDDVEEEDALGMDIRDYERWKASRGSVEESVYEGIASTRKNYLETDKINQEVFDVIEEADPTDKKKYMDWMANIIAEKDEDVRVALVRNTLAPLIKKYNDALEKNLVPKGKRDIYGMDYSALHALVNKELVGRESKTVQKKRVKAEGADQILKSDRFLVYEVYTHEAMSYYGSNTRWWCVTSDYGEGSKYWDDYVGKGIWFYVVILREDVYMSDDVEDGDDGDDGMIEDLFGNEGDKFAIAMSAAGAEVFDQEDNPLGSIEADWLTESLEEDGIEFSKHQPDRMEAGESEAALEQQREEWLDNWHDASTEELEKELVDNWADPEDEMELDDGVDATYNEKYLKQLRDDPSGLASDVLNYARDWSDDYYTMKNASEKELAQQMSYRFEEAGEEDGGFLEIPEEAMIYILSDMNYLTPVDKEEAARRDAPGQKTMAFADERRLMDDMLGM